MISNSPARPKRPGPRGREPRAAIPSRVIQDFCPMPQSLEWRLSQAFWATRGILPFMRQEVPYEINNDGRASERAAALLFAYCQKAAPDGQPIAVLELGAGSGLFARLLLDEFRRLCSSASIDFYARLTYCLTDASPEAIRQWAGTGMFAPHAAHVLPAVCDAASPAQLSSPTGEQIPLPPLAAVFMNYLLDQLPADIVRRTDNDLECLCVRTRLTGDSELLQLWGDPDVADVRALAESDDPADQGELLRLLPLLEFDAAYRPSQVPIQYAEETLSLQKASSPAVVSHAAVNCVLECAKLLQNDGFVLMRDMGTSTIPGVHAHFPTRLTAAIYLPPNLPLILGVMAGEGWQAIEAPDRDRPEIETWLVCRGEQTEAMRNAFLQHFRRGDWEAADAALSEAREHKKAGRHHQSLEAYRKALRLAPRNWALAAETADFTVMITGDARAGLRLADQALEINPWTSPYLWTVKGDCLSRMQRWVEAHDAFAKAQALDESDVRAAVGLVNCCTQLGDEAGVLLQIARALLADTTGTSRGILLVHQQQVLEVLAARHNAMRQHLRKRDAAFGIALRNSPKQIRETAEDDLNESPNPPLYT